MNSTEKEKAHKSEAMMFDSFKIEPTGEIGCFRVYVNGVEEKYVRNVKIELGVDNRYPVVTIEKYVEAVEGIDFDKCRVVSKSCRNTACGCREDVDVGKLFNELKQDGYIIPTACLA